MGGVNSKNEKKVSLGRVFFELMLRLWLSPGNKRKLCAVAQAVRGLSRAFSADSYDPALHGGGGRPCEGAENQGQDQMKLYYSPGACSLASHITLAECGVDYTIERADIRAKKTESGADFTAISPRGAVPVLVLDDGAVLTEGVSIMQYVTDMAKPGTLPAQGTLARARLHEALNFLSTEVHKSYSPFFRGLDEAAKEAQVALLNSRLALIEHQLSDGREWLLGADFTPADAYLFTVTNWSGFVAHDLSSFPKLQALRARVAARPAVVAAMTAESLLK